MEENTSRIEDANLLKTEENQGGIGNKNKNNPQQIAGAIIVAGILIAGAILLKGNSPTGGNPIVNTGTPPAVAGTVAKVDANDRVLGNSNAKVTLVMYEDFQCPFCGRFVKDSEQIIRDKYVASGQVELVYRDYAFLGPESERAAEAARCAGDQGKFWEYHDYLFTHQAGENQGAFSDPNLKSFAVSLGLNATTFNQCLESKKYAGAVASSTAEGSNAGVQGTPKGYILVNGKVVSTIDGAIPLSQVTLKIDAALK